MTANRTKIINLLPNFVGSALAVFVFGSLLVSIDISTPKTVASAYGPLISSLVVAGVYVLTEFVFDRLRILESILPVWVGNGFLKLLFKGLLISSAASIFLVMFLLFAVLCFGYISSGQISNEVTTGLIFAVLLTLLNFIFVQPLRIVAYMFSTDEAASI